MIHRLALVQVMINCIKNSLDALPAGGGAVSVTSCLDREEPEKYVTLIVWDNGSGIPPQILNQLDGKKLLTTKGNRGNGLGLHIVVDYIRRMGGRVRLASATGPVDGVPGGTVVSLCLPRDEAAYSPGLEIRPYAEYRAIVQDLLRRLNRDD